MSDWKTTELKHLVNQMVASCQDNQAVNYIEGHDLPDRKSVDKVLENLLNVLLPGYNGSRTMSKSGLEYYFGDLLQQIYCELKEQAEQALAYECRQRNETHCQACLHAERAVAFLMSQLPELRDIIKDDVKAAFERDPAASSLDVIILCYPGIEALITQRLAHVLYNQGVPIIPRMWTEQAHSRTGIDIHPGAEIGRGFFIDHGTGIVIGETADIGNNVTLYQGVTLGAMSPVKGQKLRGKKRHPSIEDDVILYAGATILGGDTVIGRGSMIGGNVWLTHSVPPGTKVLMGKNDLVFIAPDDKNKKNDNTIK